MNKVDIKDVVLSDGTRYTGQATESQGRYIPNGLGLCKYFDHNIIGMFRNGKVDGVAYRNYHEYMHVGYISRSKLNGWGMYAGPKGFSFGVWKNDRLRINLTPLLQVVWDAIMNSPANNSSIVHGFKDREEVFVGITEKLERWRRALGFHFMNTGEVYVGVSDINVGKALTGCFLHFDNDFNITLGRFVDGKFVNHIEKLDFLTEGELFATHAFYDFKIEYNYSLESYNLNKNVAFKIIETGRTPDTFIAKANLCKINGNNLQAYSKESADTIWFSFGVDDEIMSEISDIVSDNTPWVPDMDDYVVEFVGNIDRNNPHVIFYRHKSFYGESYVELNQWWDIDEDLISDGVYFSDTKVE